LPKHKIQSGASATFLEPIICEWLAISASVMPPFPESAAEPSLAMNLTL
jgi:hypothetical protein